MARQRVSLERMSLPIDGAPNTPVGANLIIAWSTTNAGNGMLATSKNAQNFAGVTYEATDNQGYAGVQYGGIWQIVAGANITAGQELVSNGSGQAIPNTPTTSGAVITQIIGVAMNTVLSGNLVDVQLNPNLVLNVS